MCMKNVHCPGCKAKHGELHAGEYRCNQCDAEFRINNPSKDNPYHGGSSDLPEKAGYVVEQCQMAGCPGFYVPEEDWYKPSGTQRWIRDLISIGPAGEGHFLHACEPCAEAYVTGGMGWTYGGKPEIDNPYKAGRGAPVRKGWIWHPKAVKIPAGFEFVTNRHAMGSKIPKRPSHVLITKVSYITKPSGQSSIYPPAPKYKGDDPRFVPEFVADSRSKKKTTHRQ